MTLNQLDPISPGNRLFLVRGKRLSYIKRARAGDGEACFSLFMHYYFAVFKRRKASKWLLESVLTANPEAYPHVISMINEGDLKASSGMIRRVVHKLNSKQNQSEDERNIAKILEKELA